MQSTSAKSQFEFVVFVSYIISLYLDYDLHSRNSLWTRSKVVTAVSALQSSAYIGSARRSAYPAKASARNSVL